MVSVRNALHLALDVIVASLFLHETQISFVWPSSRLKDDSELVRLVYIAFGVFRIRREREAVFSFIEDLLVVDVGI